MKNTVFLRIESTGTDEYKIEAGGVEGAFVSSKTLIVPNRNPDLLWGLMHELAGMPIPNSPERVMSAPETPKKKEKNGNVDFNGMSAREIVDKVRRERGIEITCSIKSKKTVISKAREIYAS